ncbi:MAG: thiol:disulfide interchange protein DsbA/DsbL [bacterium]
MQRSYRSLCVLLLSTALLSACTNNEETGEKAAQSTTPPQTSQAAPATDSTPAPNTAEASSDAANDAAPTSEFIEGQDYLTLFPELPLAAPAGKIEVTEIFWYGCPHCYSLEPVLKKYLAEEKPEYVFFRRVPGTLNASWNYHAKLYYIGQLLDSDGTKGVHEAIFNAVHQQRRRLQDDDSVKQFLISLGITEAEVDAAMKSPTLDSQVKAAASYNESSRAGSVPSIVVQGKYLTSPSMARGSARMLRLVNYLAEKEHSGTAK